MKKTFSGWIAFLFLFVFSLTGVNTAHGCYGPDDPTCDPSEVDLGGNDWGIYTGYMLYNDGWYHHGTFYWSGDPSNYEFVPDPPYYNEGAGSIGFEDFPYSPNPEDFENLG